MCCTLGAVLQGHGKADSEDSDSSHPQSPDANREPGSVRLQLVLYLACLCISICHASMPTWSHAHHVCLPHMWHTCVDEMAYCTVGWYYTKDSVLHGTKGDSKGILFLCFHLPPSLSFSGCMHPSPLSSFSSGHKIICRGCHSIVSVCVDA